MQVIVENPNTIVIDVDQGRAGRGIQNITYTEVSGQYFLIVTYTDGTTETLGPLVVTGGAAFLLGGATGSIPYQSAPNTTVFLPIGTQNQVMVAGTSAPQYTSALTGLTVNNSAIGNTTPSTGAFTNLSASGTFALTGDQVQISEGGTGQTTANAAFNALAPSQTGNAGKYLKTDGTNSSWDQLDISTADITGVLPVANGGTGASTAAGARANLSAAILGTNNDITSLTGITGGISTPDFVQFDTAATNTNAVGKVYWDAAQGTLDLGLLGGNVISRIGQSLVAYVTNAEAVTITKGQVVYLFSAQGDRATVKLAYNTSDATSAKTFGVVAENIPANGTGFVMCQGVLEGLNLGAFTAGDTLYLGATPGSLTATKPYAPNHLVYVGLVERANAGNGQLYVKVQNGYELDEIHDVQIVNPQNGQTILYDASTSLWKNANLTAGSGISVTNGAASVTIGNTGVLSFSGGTTGLTPSTSTTGAVTLGGTLAVTNGGTGATTAAGALTNLNAASQSTTISAGTGLTGGGNLSANRTLSIANTTVTAGAYGSASNTLTATVNAQGQLTALAATPIAIANTQISGLGTMSTQNSNSVTITGGSITGITDLAIADGGTGASDAPTARTNLGLGTSATLNAGVALGVATLDAGGTVPLTQLPASIQGGVSYQGSWNAATNTPTIVSGVGSKGYYYVVSVAGSTNIDGITDWLPGDWIIFNGTIWQKIDNTDAVASVNGYTGVVVLSAADVGAPPTSRTISAGTGLTGGGDLSTNRTLSIANTTVAAGSYGSASSVGTFTVNGQGQLTAAASTPIAITNTQVSGLGTMSTQNANAVAITGGSINGVTIGGSTTGAGSFTTLTTSSTVTLNGGTANGVAYLNGSKVLTTGSALTFDGTNLINATGRVSANTDFRLGNQTYSRVAIGDGGGGFVGGYNITYNAGVVYDSTGSIAGIYNTNGGNIQFYAGGSAAGGSAAPEAMRLNTTGLGIGTSSPTQKLHVVGNIRQSDAAAETNALQFSTSASSATIETRYGTPLIFGTNATPQMWLTAAGNLGIGTNTPGVKLDVVGAIRATTGMQNANGTSFYWGTGTAYILGSSATNTINFGTNGVTQATLDSSGNLGLGVTPSASWASGTRAFQFGPSSALYNPGSGSRAILASNAIFTLGVGSATYITSNAAAYYDQDNGTHKWNIAPSGTAGNAISFTQAMTLDASGNLLVGQTSGSEAIEVTRTGSTSTGLALSQTGTSGRKYIIASTGTGYGSAGNLIFYDATAAAERARITSGGDVVVTGVGGLGYGTGSGGAVTQATSRTTGVTLDKTNGAITLVSAAGTTTWQTFTVTNNKVAATDTVIVNQKSGTDLYQIFVTNVAAGSFKISFATTGGTTTEQPVFNFAVIKAVTA